MFFETVKKYRYDTIRFFLCETFQVLGKYLPY